ncbi:MAG TPA: esterase-like activity of phytase family protein [Ramlibacter sp.]|nr:esterase-like activity of phytase family protein [Ramlibacter sp.]
MVSVRTPLSRRALLRGAAAACTLVAAGCISRPPPAPPGGPPRLRLLGEAILPHGLQFRGTTVGGLSALDHDSGTGTWIALSDDRSELQPARFYALRIDIAPRALRVDLLDVITLRGANGQPFPRRRMGGEVVDPEALRVLPAGAGVLWASEGDSPANQGPSLRHARPDGSHVRDFALPDHLQLGRPGTGPRPNGTFEGLALTPDARVAWAAMEAPLQQDGREPGVGHPGGPCRFTAFDVATGRPLRQVAYLPDAVPLRPAIPGGYADNGVSEILMLDAWRMLVLERAYSLGVGNSLRLYEIDTREASDTLALDTLREGDFRAAPKRWVADFAQLGLTRLDNTEAMCWGPRRPDGKRTLVVASDDNFSARQATQFAAFEYLEAT